MLVCILNLVWSISNGWMNFSMAWLYDVLLPLCTVSVRDSKGFQTVNNFKRDIKYEHAKVYQE